jgi:hypothetical protein
MNLYKKDLHLAMKLLGYDVLPEHVYYQVLLQGCMNSTRRTLMNVGIRSFSDCIGTDISELQV